MRKCLYRSVKFIFILSAVIFAVSCFERQKLPAPSKLAEELHSTPVQTVTNAKPFDVEENGITYTVTPLFNYDLSGLVVSYHHSSDWLDYYHKEWNDYLNPEDLCVVWGGNAVGGIYQKMNFKNKSFSCWESFKWGTTENDWNQFSPGEWSNNHMLTNDGSLKEKMLGVKAGDQLRFKGYLVKYSIKGQEGGRESSTTRTDTGMGACETVFVQDFQVLKTGNPLWQKIYLYSKYPLIISFILFVLLLFRDISSFEIDTEPEAKMYDVKTKKTKLDMNI